MINDSSNIKSFKEILEEYDFAARCIKMKSSYYYKLLSKGYNIPSAGALYEYCSIQEAHKVEHNGDRGPIPENGRWLVLDQRRRREVLPMLQSVQARFDLLGGDSRCR